MVCRVFPPSVALSKTKHIKYHTSRGFAESFSKVLLDGTAAQEDYIIASHTFHEITMYYPMRTIIGKRYKLIMNLASQLNYPAAKDLWDSPTWQSALKSEGQMFGKRSIAAYTKRPRFELYDLKNDPDEVINLAQNPEYQDELKKLQGELKKRDSWS